MNNQAAKIGDRHPGVVRREREMPSVAASHPISKKTMKPGVVLACFLEEYDYEELQFGRITSIPGKNSAYVEVEWMCGAYARPWKLWKDRKGQTWKEKVPLSSVLSLIDFNNDDKLSDDTVDRLKQKYQEMHS